MTYSDNLEKLRQAGVIKVEHGEFVGLSYCPICGEENIFTTHKCITPNPLTIGRVLRWIENNHNHMYAHISKAIDENRFNLLSMRRNKDLPLDDQENREEIAEFLVSLT